MSVSLNYDVIKETGKVERAAPGCFSMVCTQAEPYPSEKSDSIMVRATWKPLQDPEDANSITGKPVTTWLILPLVNDAVPGHEVSAKQMERWADLAGNLFPDKVPGRPRKVDGVLTFNGDEIEGSEYGEKFQENVKTAAELALAIWGDNGENVAEYFTGVNVFTKVELNENGYAQIAFWNFRSELPDDWELSTEYVTKA